MRTRTQKIADMAIFIALGVILNLCSFQSFGTYLGRISLVYLFCYLEGFILGPIKGFAVAFIADLIPAIFFPTGPYVVLISISNALMAAIAGLCNKLPWKFIFRLLLTMAISFCVCTLVLTPLGETTSVFIIPVGGYESASLYSLFPYTLAKTIIGPALGISSPFLQVALAKAVQQPLWILLNSLLTYVIYSRLSSLLQKSGYVKGAKEDGREEGEEGKPCQVDDADGSAESAASRAPADKKV